MAGFGRNGSRTSPEAIATAERHREWIELRRRGLGESHIAARYGVSQQAVSKVILKYVRSVPAREAQRLRQAQIVQIGLLYETASALLKHASGHKVCLGAISAATKLLERQAKLLGLDAAIRCGVCEPNEGAEQSFLNLLAEVEPTDPELLREIQKLDPILKPDPARVAPKVDHVAGLSQDD